MTNIWKKLFQYAHHLPTLTQKLPIDVTANMKRNVYQAKKNFETTSIFFLLFVKENLKTYKTVMFTIVMFTAVKSLGKLILFFRAD